MCTKTDEGHDGPGVQPCDFLNRHFCFRWGNTVCFNEGEDRKEIRSRSREDEMQQDRI